MVGAGRADGRELELARELGLRLARGGAVILCGGLGGVMEAACAGAHSGGAVTVGLLPGEDRAAANEHVDVAIATGMGELRNALLARGCDAMVAVGGEWGTLSEIALALKLGRPVVALESWRLERPGLRDRGPRLARDPAEAAALALNLAAARGPAPDADRG